MSKKKKNGFVKNFIPCKGDRVLGIVRKIIVIIAFIVLVCSIVYLGLDLFEQIRAKQLNDELAQKHTEPVVITQQTTEPVTETTEEVTEPPPLVVTPDMEELVKQNPDTAGWIKVNNTQIDNVVVQTKDNEYYLDRDFNGNKSQPGTIFIDYRCNVNDYDENQSDNIIIYGHNQANGLMFGTLKNYKILKKNTSRYQFYLDNPTFSFSNLYNEYTYKIIAIFITEVEPEQTRDGIIFDYHNYINFTQKRTFESFKENIMARTEVLTGVDFDEKDKYVTLSTCSNEFEPSRFVVIGRRVRDGEDPEVDTSKSQLNPNAKEPDWNYIYR